MIPSNLIEQEVGIQYYVSDSPGIGGKLRSSPEDFRVRELEGVELKDITADQEKFPHLIIRVTLRDWDTNQFAGVLSDQLGISRERVSWAGTKDKRAVSTQLMSIKNVTTGELPEISGSTICPVGRMGRRIFLGDLVGNQFDVTVRDPDRPENTAAITASLRGFGGGTVGVPNFFGHQRFGSIRPITHEVGFRILNEKWKEAVLQYVGNPHENENDRTQEARQFVTETEDWAAALDLFPGHLGYERAILHHLSSINNAGPHDYRDALMELPRNIQQLFVHAAQSYMYNHILSTRLDRDIPFDEAIVGDVVCFTDRVNDTVIPDIDRLQPVTEDNVSTVNRHVSRGSAYITAPLVGTETSLSDGVVGEIEREVLNDVGVNVSDFALPGEFASTGTRRAILVHTELSVDTNPVRFSFSLPKGAYATVLLREFTKTSPLVL